MKKKSIIDNLILTKYQDDLGVNYLDLITNKYEIKSLESLIKVNKNQTNDFYLEVSELFDHLINQRQVHVALERRELIRLKKYFFVQIINGYYYQNNDFDNILNEEEVHLIDKDNYEDVLKKRDNNLLFQFHDFVVNAHLMVVRTNDEFILNEKAFSTKIIDVELSDEDKEELIQNLDVKEGMEVNPEDLEVVFKHLSQLEGYYVFPIDTKNAVILVEPMWLQKLNGVELMIKLDDEVIENNFSLPQRYYFKHREIELEYEGVRGSFKGSTKEELLNVRKEITKHYRHDKDSYIYKIVNLNSKDTLSLNLLTYNESLEKVFIKDSKYLNELISKIYNW